MTATLVAADLTVVRGAQVVLSGVSLTVAPGDRIGLVGPNGVGKSTLLAALSGRVPLDSGRLALAPPTAQVGLLPQEPERRPGETLLALLERRTGVEAAQAALTAAAEGLAGPHAGAADAYDTALQAWLELGGADLDARAVEVCGDLGLPRDLLGVPTAALSGGQAARASLAGVLLSRFDITLLDEPTNDLDFAGLDRLEAFVAGVPGALVLVSHDREFLDRCVTSVAELDPHTHGVTVFGGGWSSYVEQRELSRRQARDRYDAFESSHDALLAQAQRQREQSVRGAVRAQRRGSDNDRALRGSRIEAATKSASRVRSIENRIERLPAVEEPRKEWQLRMEIASAPRSGDEVATLSAAVVRLGGFTLGPVDLAVGWADRIAITGANGSGKSTLLAALLGRVSLSGGTRRLGAGVRLGTIDQTRSGFRGRDSLLDTAARLTDWPPQEVRTLWAKFGLSGDRMTRAAVDLSPGERTRAELALLQAVGVNLLMLDEPTNHLDLPAITALEQALDAYAGTLVLVTHDRRMLGQVRLTRRLDLAHGTVTELAV